MNVVTQLIRKDVYLHRQLGVASLVLGVVALGLLAGGGETRLYMGGVLAVTVLIGLGATLAILTVVEERQQQNLPFIMSLPISPRQYAAAKILANALVFGAVWVLLVAGSQALIWIRADLPDGVTVFAILVAVEIVASTCLILAVAMITRSLAWSLGTMVGGNLAFNGFVFQMFRTTAYAGAAESPAVVWPPQALTLLLVELAAIALLLGIAFVVSTRRKDVL